MKRSKMAQLLLVLLVLTATALSASTTKPEISSGPSKGGSGVQSKSSEPEYWYYCYDDPSYSIYVCPLGTSSNECRQECEQTCGGPCDWEVEA
jgi:hypothetical protein